MPNGFTFNPPPGWPTPPPEWDPPAGWTPDAAWPPAPPGWSFWLPQAPLLAPSPSPPAAPEASARHVGLPDDPVATVEPTASASAAGTTSENALDVTSDLSIVDDDQRNAIADYKAELERLTEQIVHAQATLKRAAEAQVQLADVQDQLVELNDALLLQQVGIYEYHHPLENAEEYRSRLRELSLQIRDAVRGNAAIHSSDRFAYNNSLAAGKKMTSDFGKLMLRAYNAEADSCVRSLRAGTADSAFKRLDGAADAIAKLGSMMDMYVTEPYQQLRREEIALTSDYLMKVQEEKEDAREERERLREERKAAAELAAERERLNKERTHYENTRQALLAQGRTADADALDSKMAEIDLAIQQNDYRAANIRAGYVYVISNVGAFGPDVVKIGLTRRLDPLDRVRELGSASVPFPFDVHAIYFSGDAVTLEAKLHDKFSARRMNQVNQRREFFFATPDDVRQALAEQVGNLLEFTEEPEATQFHQSQSSWPHLPLVAASSGERLAQTPQAD